MAVTVALAALLIGPAAYAASSRAVAGTTTMRSADWPNFVCGMGLASFQRLVCTGSLASADNVVRPVLFMSPAVHVLDLLLEMRLKRTHMAVVVDEFGGIDGIHINFATFVDGDMAVGILELPTEAFDEVPSDLSLPVTNYQARVWIATPDGAVIREGTASVGTPPDGTATALGSCPRRSPWVRARRRSSS